MWIWARGDLPWSMKKWLYSTAGIVKGNVFYSKYFLLAGKHISKAVMEF